MGVLAQMRGISVSGRAPERLLDTFTREADFLA